MAQINIRIDDALKAQGEDLFRALGLSFSAAVSLFISQAVRVRGIPFAVTAKEDPFWSAENQHWLAEGLKAHEAGEFVPHELVEDEAA
jgi:DNA-damage-inducible protein J